METATFGSDFVAARTAVDQIIDHCLTLMYLCVTGFYPSPKYIWSCTHETSCQNYILYINLHILLNILSKTTLNIQESRKSIKCLKRYQDFIKKSKSIVSCYVRPKHARTVFEPRASLFGA